MLEAKVIHGFKCKHTKKVFKTGDTYRYPDEARMIELANLPTPRVEWPPKHKAPAEPKHVGGGWYELPGGRRVQGKQAALEALIGT